VALRVVLLDVFHLRSSHLCGDWCWLSLPLARSPAFSSLTTANELGTGVQMNCNRLDPAHGLVAVDSVQVVNQMAAAIQLASATSMVASAGETDWDLAGT
jgi:hypothetical protein